jgi:nitronate monooxygenase
MKIHIPTIIQGGMGAGVSSWRLARAVSRLGQLGVVSGTGLDQILVRRLQDGDLGGDIRRALQAFPFPRLAKHILDAYFIPGGKKPEAPYTITAMHTANDKQAAQALCIAGNFVEVYLAREGHENPVGINYLEKIQLPHLPSIYGAMLGGAAVIIMGAGIPVEVPGVLDALAQHQATSYPLHVTGAIASDNFRMPFDPAAFQEPGTPPPALRRPAFLPIVASVTLATMLARKSNGVVDGFIIEGPVAGGHNAPPRGALKLAPDGAPVYGPRDVVDLAAMRALGLPFWLAGGYGSPERYREALAEGAAGIQVGTAFALCVESEIVPEIRKALILKALAGKAEIFTDPVASPTGYPFKVALLEKSLSEKPVYLARRRVCDLGFLRELYRCPNGTIGYRCAAEQTAAFVAKGGALEDTVGRVCLCNSLVANVGMSQRLPDGTSELCLITLGDDLTAVGRFCTLEHPDYSAADVIRILLG